MLEQGRHELAENLELPKDGKTSADISTKQITEYLCDCSKGTSHIAVVLRKIATSIGRIKAGSNIVIDALPNHTALLQSPLFKDIVKHIARFKAELKSGLAFMITGEGKDEKEKKISNSDEANPQKRHRRSMLFASGIAEQKLRIYTYIYILYALVLMNRTVTNITSHLLTRNSCSLRSIGRNVSNSTRTCDSYHAD